MARNRFCGRLYSSRLPNLSRHCLGINLDPGRSGVGLALILSVLRARNRDARGF